MVRYCKLSESFGEEEELVSQVKVNAQHGSPLVGVGPDQFPPRDPGRSRLIDNAEYYSGGGQHMRMHATGAGGGGGGCRE